MITKKKELLGTIFSISLPSEFKHLFAPCFNEVKRIEKKYSRFLSTSYLSSLNSNCGKWQSIDVETYYLLEQGFEIYEESEGIFSLALKQALDNSGYDSNYTFKKKHFKFSNPFKKRGFELTKDSVLLYEEIEFGGLGKGYAIDCVKKILNEKEVPSYFINAGGDVFGKYREKSYLEHPDDSSRVIGEIELTDKALCSSSPNRRQWRGGHHLIYSKTKKPTKNDMKSVFVIHYQGIKADAFATTLFCMGFNTARKFAQEKQIECVLISTSNKIYSNNFSGKLY